MDIKILIIIFNIIIILFLFTVTYMTIKYFLNQIEKYPKVTLEEIYNSKKNRTKYDIEEKVNPLDYGFEFEELKYKSDKINLCGWYIKNNDTKNMMVISHGRGINRLAVLQYLQLVKDLDLHKKYNIFIPDLRNSGNSDDAKTFMGHCFGKDILNTVVMLNERYEYNNFVLYGFSQGGIGSAITTKLYKKQLRKHKIKIEKMVLDSPIANIEKKVKSNARKKKVPKFIVSIIIRIFNLRVGNNLGKLHLSYLLGSTPTLVLQSKQDQATTYGDLMSEYNGLSKNKNIAFKIFEKGAHVRLYVENKEEYTKRFAEFFDVTVN